MAVHINDQIELKNIALTVAGVSVGLSDVFLSIRYQGDEARLLVSDDLFTDNLFNGPTWQIGLKRFLSRSSLAYSGCSCSCPAIRRQFFFELGSAPKPRIALRSQLEATKPCDRS